MLTAAQPVCPSPFDAIAPRYDDIFTSSRIGQAQRAAVWKGLAKAFRPGARILEIGCGTGVDAAFLAQRGVHVVACDSSSQMIDAANSRIRDEGLQNFVQTIPLRAEDLATLYPSELFDGAYSNFGALNCVNDLGSLARNLAHLIKPGATALLCWMGPFCLWETLWYIGKRDAAKAFRRMHRNGITAKIADGAFIQVHYPSLRTLKRVFAPEFRLRSFSGVGVTVPPSYLEAWAAQFPRTLGCCVWMDSFLGRCPGVRIFADHILLRFERT